MYNLTYELIRSVYCMSIVKCGSGKTFLRRSRWATRLKFARVGENLRLLNTGSGEPTSCALLATNELLPNGPQIAHLQNSGI